MWKTKELRRVVKTAGLKVYICISFKKFCLSCYFFKWCWLGDGYDRPKKTTWVTWQMTSSCHVESTREAAHNLVISSPQWHGHPHCSKTVNITGTWEAELKNLTNSHFASGKMRQFSGKCFPPGRKALPFVFNPGKSRRWAEKGQACEAWFVFWNFVILSFSAFCVYISRKMKTPIFKRKCKKIF